MCRNIRCDGESWKIWGTRLPPNFAGGKKFLSVKKCKPNLNQKSHYRAQDWTHWRRSILAASLPPFCPKRAHLVAAFRGHPNSCAMAHRQGSPLPPRIGEPRHRNGGFFMRWRRLESVETGGRLSRDGVAQSRKKCLEAIDEKRQNRRAVQIGRCLVQKILQNFFRFFVTSNL